MGVKATCEKDGRIKSISFTPPVGEPSMLGEKRLTMTEAELLKEARVELSPGGGAGGGKSKPSALDGWLFELQG